MNLHRRGFLKKACLGLCALGSGIGLMHSMARALSDMEDDRDGPVEVMHYTKLEGGRIQCDICPRRCRIADNERGYCGNKENRGGRYYTLVHSRPCAVHVDPIEKKPLFHVYPGSKAFSIATAGCNIECKFCQNWQIAQFRPEQVRSFKLPPEEVVRLAKEEGCRTIAYTYSEPVTFYGYMYDTARLGKREGVESVVITNGYINETPLEALCEHLLAVKVDLKAFSEKFYREICSGELEPVKKTLLKLKALGMWTEIVVLIVPTLNDERSEIGEMCNWIKGELGEDIPVHFTRFYPSYKIRNLPPTPVRTLEMCREIARDVGLRFVYLGNLPGHPAESTYCPNCEKIVIGRVGYRITELNVKDGRCTHCKTPIPGIWV